VVHYSNDYECKFIPEFPNYQVSTDGRVFNVRTSRDMTLSPTLNDDLTVGLMKDGIQYRRSVKVLVARAFVPGETELFNTPMLLDGDKENLIAENIVWRPRWFSWTYARQFIEPYPEWYHNGPIMNVRTEMRYHTIFSAAMIHGSLCEDIYQSLENDTPVFPTGERYVLI
jgi:hypothetical protein